MDKDKPKKKASNKNEGEEEGTSSKKVDESKEEKNKRSSFSKYGRHGFLVAAEILAVILLIVSIVLGLSVWRLKSGPVDISFANDYIEAALKDEERGLYGTMNKSALYWPDLNGPLLLGLKDGQIFNGNDEEVLSVDEIALSLSKRHLFIGQIRPVALIIRQPSLTIVRSEDNSIDFGFVKASDFVDVEPENDGDEQENLINDILEYIEDPEKTRDGTPLSYLNTFAIENAQVMVEDHVLEASWFFPDFDIMFNAMDDGLKSDFKLTLPSISDDENSYIQSSVTLKSGSNNAHLNGKINNLDLRIFAGKSDAFEILSDQNIVLNGQIEATLDQNFNPEFLKAGVMSQEGHIFHQDLSDDAVPYTNLSANIEYTSEDNQRISARDIAITLKDMTFRAEADIESLPSDESIEGSAQEGYKSEIRLRIDDTPHSALPPLWPKFLEGDASEEWLVKKMSDGTLSDLKARANITALKNGEEWTFDVKGLLAEFAFKDLSMDYRAPLPAVTNANGSGRFDLDTDILTINIEDAQIKGLNVSKTALVFDDVAAEGKGGADMSINLNGPLRNVFEYLSTEPIDLKDELDMNLSRVKGDAVLKVEMAFPTKDDLGLDEIDMNVSGTVSNGFLPDVLEGLSLSGGPFKVDVNNERYTVNGNGMLGGQYPVSLDWFEYMESEGKKYKHRAKAQITANQNLRDYFGIDLSDFLSGEVPLDLTYTKFLNDRAEIDIDADITPARFFVESFDYTKPSGRSGSATFKAYLSNDVLRRVRVDSASAKGFKLQNTDITFRGSGENIEVSKAEIGRGVIGETIGSSTIEIAPNGVMTISMQGPFLDLRPFLNDENDAAAGEYDEPPSIISVSVDQMRTSDASTVQYAKMYVDIDGKGRFNQLEMDAIAGQGDLYLRYKPNNQGVRTFRFEADDAGAALNAFEVYSNIRGGKLVVYAEPINDVYDRNLIGVAQITDFRVVNAPSLAKLISALSLPGILNALDNDGLGFSKLEANFDWLYRPQGALLVLKNGRTSGNSLGLTFDGVFDNAAGSVDVSGTIIPLSGINNIIGSIPLVGDIVTGGTGALFAATYSMKGPYENPRISVNPLSVLAPGILRRILFE